MFPAGESNVGSTGDMRRSHGATTRPPLPRPGAGYGRPVRAAPPEGWRDRELTADAQARDPQQLLSASADVTPPS
jgi:hypothetical protein